MQKKEEHFGAMFGPKMYSMMKMQNGSMRSKKV